MYYLIITPTKLCYNKAMIRKIGLGPANRYAKDATTPFKLTFSILELDKRTLSYTPQHIIKLQTPVSGER